MKYLQTLLIISACSMLLIGCEDTGDEAEDVVDAMGDLTEETADQVEDATDDTVDALEDSCENVEDAAGSDLNC